MPELRQTIRFCTSGDGARIAYATMGKGPPLVRAALLADLEALWTRHNKAAHGSTRYDGEYLEVVAIRA
jgi:hypothetical protein